MTNYRQALIDKIDCNIEQSEVVAGKIRTAYLFAGQGFPVIVLHGAGAGAVTWYPSFGEKVITSFPSSMVKQPLRSYPTQDLSELKTLDICL